MPHRHTTTRTTTTRRHHGLFSRAQPAHHHSTPVHHHKRHATLGDKVSGALLKLKGTLTHRPGQKVCRSHLTIQPCTNPSADYALSHHTGVTRPPKTSPGAQESAHILPSITRLPIYPGCRPCLTIAHRLLGLVECTAPTVVEAVVPGSRLIASTATRVDSPAT